MGGLDHDASATLHRTRHGAVDRGAGHAARTASGRGLTGASTYHRIMLAKAAREAAIQVPSRSTQAQLLLSERFYTCAPHIPLSGADL
jgi:hypothetical protein